MGGELTLTTRPFDDAEIRYNQEVKVVRNMAALCVMKSVRTALSAVHCAINNSLIPRLLNGPQLSFFGCTSSRGIRQGKFYELFIYLTCSVRHMCMVQTINVRLNLKLHKS